MVSLQVEHIEEKQICIPSSISKNKKTDYVEINKDLEKITRAFDLQTYPCDYYVLSKLNYLSTIPINTNTIK